MKVRCRPRGPPSIVKRIAEAIEYAHQRGTLHRDLKPANVLIDAVDQPRVTDFGLAKRIDGTARLTCDRLADGDTELHATGASGSRRWKGRSGERRLFAGCGAVLTRDGPTAVSRRTLVVTLDQVLNTEPVSPRLLNPEVPRDLETICLKCSAKRAKQTLRDGGSIG